MSELKLCFYGDDFTGSTDALESLVRAGLRAMLFIDPPTPFVLSQYPGLQAVGVAGCSRALSLPSMDKQLRPAFLALRALGAPHIHYKVCSTFDSSPTLGNIGRVMELAREYFPSRFVPIVAGTPALGRYCVFGNLFAELGTNNPREVFRLDQHPVMSHHPSTPMCEAEIVKHLSKQTTLPFSLMNVIDLEQPLQVARKTLNSLYSNNFHGVVFDSLHDGHLTRIGELLDPYGSNENPLFTIGSSSVGFALASRWQTNEEAGQGYLDRPSDELKPVAQTKPMLVGSGSCSPVTIGQIREAVNHRMVEVLVYPERILNETTRQQEIERVKYQAGQWLGEGRNVIIHTSRMVQDQSCPDLDPHYQAVCETRNISKEDSAHLIGSSIGQIMLDLVGQYRLKRICLCGGDTSGYAARVLGIQAIEMISSMVRGAPLCRAMAPDTAADRLEVVFKGGQVGNIDFFQTFLNHVCHPQSKLAFV